MATKRPAEDNDSRPAKKAKTNEDVHEDVYHAVSSGVNLLVANVATAKAWYIRVLDAASMFDQGADFCLLRLPGGALVGLNRRADDSADGSAPHGSTPAPAPASASVFIGVSNLDAAVAAFETRADASVTSRTDTKASFVDLDGNALSFTQVGGNRGHADAAAPWTIEFEPGPKAVSQNTLISIRKRTPVGLLGDFVHSCLVVTWSVLSAEALSVVGAPVAIYHGDCYGEAEWDVEVGFPVESTARLGDRILVGDTIVSTRTVLPAGSALCAVVRGHYDHLRAAWPLFVSYARANPLSGGGPPAGGLVWEEYLNDPSIERNANLWKTQLWFPIGGGPK
eukprot:a511478_51.p1 GENE.a511478_51~~a511478_51.p1  ORF type:complete len:347 (-),score=128.35 a511478_51:16-1029(-)